MKKPLAGALAVVAVAVAAPACAGETGVSLALRSGFGLPIGNLSSGISLGDQLSGSVPVWLDGGYRFTRQVFAGAYFQYGIGIANNCGAGASCSATSIRFGLEGIYDFLPEAVFAPWAGLGVGYEVLTLGFQQGATRRDASASGLEIFNVQAGANYRVSDTFSVGPFAAFSLGRYSNVSRDGVSQTVQTSSHGWLQLGLKGTFNL